jgi:hypothetical protein
MKLFACPVCHQTLYFENFQCTRCGHALAYLPDRGVLTALEPVAKAADAADVPGVPGVLGLFTALGPVAKEARYRQCGNQIDHKACNWAVPEAEDQRFCQACRLNEIIPNLGDPKATAAWLTLENSKRRLIYTLLQLRLPIEQRNEKTPEGLAFAFKQDLPGEEKVFIEHNHGLITINIEEANSPSREKTRLELGESYRTVLGHFRHEIGHYYWDRLVDNSPALEPFRRLFGDERASYEEAAKVHYRDGAPADWRERFVSAYATMHPWEDWAESWAHYLHIVDTLETARSFGLDLRPRSGGAPGGDGGSAERKLEAHTRGLDLTDFDDLVGAWVPLTVALNSLNRSMGAHDPYPFVLSPPAIEKMRIVHDVVERAGKAPPAKDPIAAAKSR